MSDLTRTPRALTIAGSDSGGGAGIQADLKAFARCGVHGMSAITAITAQSTLGVSAVHSLAPEMVLAQIRAVVADIGVDAIKVGMLGSAEVVHAVAQALAELPADVPVVVDPVMVSESGSPLLDPDARDVLVSEILPLATVVTPNLPEARALAPGVSGASRRESGSAASTANVGSHLHKPVGDERVGGEEKPGGDERVGGEEGVRGEEKPGGDEGVEGDEEAGGEEGELLGDRARAALESEERETIGLARAILALGPRVVVLTGGHRAQATDLYLQGSGASEQMMSIPGERHPDGAAHGSGCTHSSVLAAQLALGRAPLQAAFAARALTGAAVANGLRDIGQGPGPVDIFGLARIRSH